MFVNQIVYIDSNCTCFAHCMLHLAVIINDIAELSVRLTSAFDWRVIEIVIVGDIDYNTYHGCC